MSCSILRFVWRITRSIWAFCFLHFFFFSAAAIPSLVAVAPCPLAVARWLSRSAAKMARLARTTLLLQHVPFALVSAAQNVCYQLHVTPSGRGGCGYRRARIPRWGASAGFPGTGRTLQRSLYCLLATPGCTFPQELCISRL